MEFFAPPTPPPVATPPPQAPVGAHAARVQHRTVTLVLNTGEDENADYQTPPRPSPGLFAKVTPPPPARAPSRPIALRFVLSVCLVASHLLRIRVVR